MFCIGYLFTPGYRQVAVEGSYYQGLRGHNIVMLYYYYLVGNDDPVTPAAIDHPPVVANYKPCGVTGARLHSGALAHYFGFTASIVFTTSRKRLFTFLSWYPAAWTFSTVLRFISGPILRVSNVITSIIILKG